MSLVDATTGELVDILDKDSAFILTKRITRQTAKVNSEAGHLVELIADALKGKAWVALGYGSWGDLVDAQGWEFTPRTSTDRAALAQVLRESGMSYRAIGKLVGASKSQIERDVEGIVPNGTPDEVVGTDGKSYPALRPVADVAADLAGDELHEGEAEAIADTIGDATPEQVGAAIDEAIESRDPAPITKPDLGGGISHPARYSSNLLPLFADILAGYDVVLDPFAGTGRIHELEGHDTIGIELEAEWAALHEKTFQGSALELPFEDMEFDAVCTSPTYGNRLADSHNASDPERRRSYTHDLGRPLSDNNSGAMQWGDRYREFHEAAWAEAVRVLRPGGRFVLNIKDHIRAGVQQPVAAWHVAALVDLGLRFNAELSQGAPTGHLQQGANAEARAGQELVLVFDRGVD
jgi:SAM-dependent methyltransferase